MLIRFVIYASTLVLLLPVRISAQGSRAFFTGESGGAAMDAKGRWHLAKDYPAGRKPWEADLLRAFGPEYPSRDQVLKNEGTGAFGLTLDPKKGVVTDVKILRSTGFASLDNAAIATLRRWQWKPGLWRAVLVPITFEMSTGHSPRLPPRAVPLPRENEHFGDIYRLGSRERDWPQ